jgi:outer membrane protein assembly factor BamB
MAVSRTLILGMVSIFQGLFFIIILMHSCITSAQNWPVIGGGNERSNASPHPGKLDVSAPLWVVNNASPTDLGGNIYSYGDRFITTRFKFSSPGQARVECRSLLTGALIWTTPLFVPDSKVHAMAFNEDAVYVHDYSVNNERFYALDPETGQVKWSYPSYTFAPLDGPIFDCNRNPIINTSRAEFNQNTSLLRSVDKNTGATRWLMQEVVDTRPNRVKAAHGSKLYMITGTALTPKKLSAFDLETGQLLYRSGGISGAALQNLWPFVGPDGTVYAIRDAGDLNAFEDTGSGLSLKWQFSPANLDVLSIPAVEADGNVLLLDEGKIKRISRINGQLLASSAESSLAPSSTLFSCADSVVILCNQSGLYQGFSHDLQNILWTINVGSSNYYAHPNLSAQGIMVTAGAGTKITAFGNSQQNPPVASFSASRYLIQAGDSIIFSNQSSYQPTSLQWTFEGGFPQTSILQNPVVSYNGAGSFRVKLIAQNSLGSDTLLNDCYITVTEATAVVDDRPNLQEFVLFPNPAEDFFFIDGQNNQDLKTIRLLNAQGKVVLDGLSGQYPFKISLSALPAGIYQVLCGDKPILAGKILKL